MSYILDKKDDATAATVYIDYVHHEIHDGDMFQFVEVIQLGSAASQDYIITTPDTAEWAHLGFDVESCAGGITVYLYEGSDRNGTTAQTTYDRNRNTRNTASVVIEKNQSGGTTDGTLIDTWTSGTSTSAGKNSGKAGSGEEWILKADTKYLFRITSKAASNDIAVRLNWYEHTNLI